MKKIFLSLLVLLFLCACGQPFNKEVWLKEPEKRSDRVYSFLNKYELVGMTEEEIIRDQNGKLESHEIDYS